MELRAYSPLIGVLMYVLLNLAIDILYTVVDPRIGRIRSAPTIWEETTSTRC